MNSTNSNEAIRNYKHDIAGKFKDISTAINSLNENSFNDPEALEIFHAVHEVILKMVKTSRNTMMENLNQEIVLVVSDKEADIELPKLQIAGVTVRYAMKEENVTYYYYVQENDGDVCVNTGKIQCLLPVGSIKNESDNE